MNVSAKILDAALGKRVAAKAIVSALLLGLCSCIPPLRGPDPAPDVPADYHPAFSTTNKTWESSPDKNAGCLGIEEFFNDSILTSLINQAIMNNRELKILDEEIQIARNEILARQGAYLPFIGVGGTGSMEKTSRYTRNGAVDNNLDILPGQSFPNPLWDVGLGFNFFWTPDIWRQLRNARDAAGQRYNAAIEKRNYFVTRLIAETAENYYRLMSLDQRMQTLDQTIKLQQASYVIAEERLKNGRGTKLAVQRFLAEVRKAQAEKLIVAQGIVQTENRVNFLLNRYPQPVERMMTGFFDLNINRLCIGIPPQLLQNRPDIRQAERELAAAGLDVLVARARFYPTMTITGNVGYEAFNPRYLFNPEALAANAAANLVAPLINKKAIQADYMTANAKQLQAVYNYQRTVLNAFTEVVNRVSKVENYTRSLEVKRQQLTSLEVSVEVAKDLFNSARIEYVDVLLAQRDYMDARMVLIETKNEQLAAIVNAYQALGGGGASMPPIPPAVRPNQRAFDALQKLWHFGAHEQSQAITPTVLEGPMQQGPVLPAN